MQKTLTVLVVLTAAALVGAGIAHALKPKQAVPISPLPPPFGVVAGSAPEITDCDANQAWGTNGAGFTTPWLDNPPYPPAVGSQTQWVGPQGGVFTLTVLGIDARGYVVIQTAPTCRLRFAPRPKP